ncbi:unnamed protein product [Diabrotica balteata]|uniref:Uncharacterized protein n=1 Tax=Diabrotica balteata TaxID=107213 RepID=A0A9N9XKK1_DIABA|nr:unnamed protein product [Diabrotica balteata]
MLVIKPVIIDVFVFGILSLAEFTLAFDSTAIESLSKKSLERIARTADNEIISNELIENTLKHINITKSLRKGNRRTGRKRAGSARPLKRRARRRRIGNNLNRHNNRNASESNTLNRRPVLRRRKFRKRRRKQKVPARLAEVTTTKGIIISTKTDSNDTLNKLIEKLNKNPEDNFDEFKYKQKTEKLVLASQSTFFDPLANITDLVTSNNESKFTTTAKHNFEKKFSRCRKNRGGCAHICNPKGIVKCSCLEGFYLGSDQKSCYDIDECKTNNGGCEKECVNQIGSYSCKCPTGFTTADDRKSCQDINECLLRNGHGPCQDTCRNTFGSYNCSCAGLKGTKLSTDGHSCEDVDECKTNNGGCSHNCINALGRSFCSCPDGMELSSDWKTCQDINECETEEMLQTCKTCINTQGSYMCLDMTDMQSDQSTNNVVCKPLFPPTRGFIRCTRKGAFQSFTKKGRRRIINSPGTACELVCPYGYKLTGDYNFVCGINGEWQGKQNGKCIEAPPPVLTCPTSQNLVTENGTDTVHIRFSSPITDVNWKYVTSFPSWAKNLEGTLTKGKHDIRFTVKDPATRLFSSCYFIINVD